MLALLALLLVALGLAAVVLFARAQCPPSDGLLGYFDTRDGNFGCVA